MSLFSNLLSAHPVEKDPSQDQSQKPPAGVYVTQAEMMDAMKKLQSQVEDCFRAERNKRAECIQKLSEDVAKRFAEVEGNLLHEVREQQQHLEASPSTAPAEAERPAQGPAQREARLAAAVGENPTVPSRALAGTSDVQYARSIASGVSDPDSRIMLLDQLKARSDELETDMKKLAATAGALQSRSSDDVTLNNARPSRWRQRGQRLPDYIEILDNIASDMQAVSKRVTNVEVKMKAFEQQLDAHVQASIKKEIESLGLDRGR